MGGEYNGFRHAILFIAVHVSVQIHDHAMTKVLASQ